MDDLQKKLMGQRIREQRLKRGLSQDQIADSLEMKRSNISNYESGRTVPPGNVLSDLADILNTNSDYLLGRTDNPNPDRLTVNETNEEYVINTAFHDYDNLTEEEVDYLKTQLEIFRKIKSERKK